MSGAGWLGAADLALFEALNALIGRSWAFDSLVAIGLDSPLAKAGPIGACFFYAWFRAGEPEAAARRHRILLITLAALFLVAPTTKAMSESLLSPRPFVLAGPVWTFDGTRLEEAPPVPVRALQSGEVADRIEGLRQGRVERNDFFTWPSDHAAFFFALSLGILLASRAAGAIALGWTLVAVLAPRVAVGLHWPGDVAAGALIGAMLLMLLQLGGATVGRRPLGAVAGWAGRNPGISAGLLFLLLLEAALTMKTLKDGMELGVSVAGGLM